MAIQCLSVLDVLMSLAKYVGAADGVTCRPEIIEPKADTEVNGGQDLEEVLVLIQIQTDRGYKYWIEPEIMNVQAFKGLIINTSNEQMCR